MRDESRKFRTFTRRSFLAMCAQLALFTILGSRFYYLQIWERKKYQTLADSNRIRLSIVPQLRGEVYAHDDQLIITSRQFFRLAIDSHKSIAIMAAVDAINPYLSHNLNLSQKELAGLLVKSSKYSPVVLQNDVLWADIAAIKSRSYKFPNIMIEQIGKRSYPKSEATAHITGYVAPPNEQELKELSIPNYNDFVIGKNGIERALDNKLRGQPGIRKTEVDAKGQVIREFLYEHGTNGDPVKLSIDLDLQQHVHSLLSEQSGAIVVLDASTGKVLALHSTPAYDPNLFISGISQSDWHQLTSDPHKPLINKCISAVYPPGSTFKMVTGLAALENNIDPEMQVRCTGEYKVGNRIFHCWNRHGHGNVNMKRALAQSCNTYFYYVAEKIGIKQIVRVGRILGLGAVTGIELPFESSGLIPDRSWKRTRYQQDWMQGDTVNAAIGQGYVLTTIMQLAVMLSRIVSGRVLKPSICIDSSSEAVPLALRPEHLDIVKYGVYAAFNEPYGKNYASRLNIPGFEMSGKSGTAQVASLSASKKRNLIDHGLFLGFAPYNNPRYVVASIVEHGGWGSVSAMPLVRSIMQFLANRKSVG